MTNRERVVELLMQKGFGVEGATIAADHLIANGVTFAKDTDVHSKWISVEERLPADRSPVLIFSKQGLFCAVARWTGSKWELGWNHDEILSVRHWMPLPQPPREE